MHEQPGAASGDRPDADPVFAQRIMVCASAQKSIHTAVQSPELRYVRATVTECPLLRTGRASAATCVCTRVSTPPRQSIKALTRALLAVYPSMATP